MIFNGKTKVALTIGGGLAVLAAVFTAGGSYATVTSHVSDTERHESANEKSRRIDERVKMHLSPIEVKLYDMDKKIDRLLDERSTP